MKQRRIYIYRNLFVTGMLFTIYCGGFSQLCAQPATEIKNFTITNGLAQNAISGMVFDNTGYLWLAVTNGLIRYDGFEFKTYFPDTLNSKTNAANQVLTIFSIGPDKKVFIRTKNGLLYTTNDGKLLVYDSTIRNTTFTYGLEGHFPNVQIFNKFNLPYDQLVHKHDWDANTRKVLPVNTTDFIVLSNNKHILFYYKNGIKQNSIDLNNEFGFFLRAGKYGLMGDNNNNLYLYDNITQTFIPIRNPLTSNNKNGDAEKPTYYWDTYNDESYCYYKDVFYSIKIDSVTKSLQLIPCFAIKKNDHIWGGIIYDPLNAIYYLRTLDEGLFLIKLKQVQTFNLADNSSMDNSIRKTINYSLLKTSDSTVLTTTGLEFTAGKNGITVKKKADIFSNRETISLSGDSGIVCAEGNSLFYYLKSDNYKRKYIYNDSFNRHNNSYVTLLQPEGDSLWVGTRHSITCITRKTENILVRRNNDDKSAYFGICLFYRVSKYAALISNNFGLYKLKTSAPYTIDTFPEMKGKQVRYISTYKDGLLLSVYKHGLYVYQNNLFYKVPISEDRSELNFCHSTYIDKTGDVWITTDKGLFRTSIISIFESISNSGIHPFFFKYAESVGIVNTEFNGAGTPSYAVLANGQLFYPSMDGIVTFNPLDLSDTLSHASIPVEKVETNKETYQLSTDTINLTAGNNYLNITLSVPYFGEPENLLLEYNLDSTGWKKIQVYPSQSIALYNLSSGYHQLVIRKRVGFASTDYIYKKLSIVKAKPITKQVWFYFAIITVLILLGAIIITMQTKNLAKKRIALQKLVQKQRSELSKTVEIKELLINIISHDLVSPIRHINLIAGFLEKGLEKEPAKIIEALSDIESTSDRILNESLAIIDYMKYNSGKVIVHKEDINIYTLVQQVCEIFVPIAKEKNIGLFNKINISEFAQIDSTIFGIILNNIVSNAIKYAGKGDVDIFTEPGKATTILKIKDTGMGMSKETLNVIQEVLKENLQIIKTTNKASTGLGFVLIAELIKIHELSVSVESEVNLGTTVSITIPR